MGRIEFKGSYQDIERIAQSILDTLTTRIPNAKEYSKSEFLRKSVEFLHGSIAVLPTPAIYEVDGGSLIIYPDRHFKIQLSPTTSPLRDNFTIAHELGHFFLHYDYDNPDNKEIIFTRYGSGPFEWQANRFAAAFLMPKSEFSMMRKQFNNNLFLIASHFEVSQIAAQKRMEYISE